MCLYVAQTTTTNTLYYKWNYCRNSLKSFSSLSYHLSIPYYRLLFLAFISMIPMAYSQSRVTPESSMLQTSQMNSSYTASLMHTPVTKQMSPSCQTTAMTSSSQRNSSCINSSINTMTTNVNTSCPQAPFWCQYEGGDNLNVTADYQTEIYYDMFSKLLRKFDCRRGKGSTDFLSYSHRSGCFSCRVRYKEWLYSQFDYIENGTAIPSCSIRICQRAKRACPYIHPIDDNSSYSSEPSFLCTEKQVDKPGRCYYFHDPEGEDNSIDPNCKYSDRKSICFNRCKSVYSASLIKILAVALLTLLYISSL